ncbi:MAG TPA: hypothetical protein VGS20_14785 [Candidatus Acidoferrales bacterium]|nr:hypothetical protein [Candidatus Acidoferrales bacterium]
MTSLSNLRALLPIFATALLLVIASQNVRTGGTTVWSWIDRASL